MDCNVQYKLLQLLDFLLKCIVFPKDFSPSIVNPVQVNNCRIKIQKPKSEGVQYVNKDIIFHNNWIISSWR